MDAERKDGMTVTEEKNQEIIADLLHSIFLRVFRVCPLDMFHSSSILLEGVQDITELDTRSFLLVLPPVTEFLRRDGSFGITGLGSLVNPTTTGAGDAGTRSRVTTAACTPFVEP